MQLDIIRAIQHYSNPVLDIVMQAFTLCGEQMIVSAIFCFVYWCADKRLGRFLAVALGVSVCLNGAVKDIFKVERLFGAEGIRSLRAHTATGYSFPSGHTQTAATFWGGLMLAAKKPAVRAIPAFLILMVGFSRLYLGVHYPADVAGGLIAGLICAFVLYYIIIVKQRYAPALLICLIAGILALAVGSSADTFKAVGTLAGILAGLYFEEKFVGFDAANLIWPRKLTRYALGMALVGAAYIIPKLILPAGFMYDILRYMLTVFVAAGLAPYIFKRLRL